MSHLDKLQKGIEKFAGTLIHIYFGLLAGAFITILILAITGVLN